MMRAQSARSRRGTAVVGSAVIAAVFAGWLVAPSVNSTPALAEGLPLCRGEVATIVGTPGNDHLIGTAGDDVIVGLEGRDIVFARGGDDLICGGPSVVEFDDEGYRMYQDLRGGSGDDHLFGGDGADGLNGQKGDDVLRAAAGEDYVDGREGRDRIFGGDDADHLEGGDDRDRLRGGAAADEIIGTQGDDVLHGEGGDDILDGAVGDDLLDGGPGRDVAALNRVWYGDEIRTNGSDVRADLRHGSAQSRTLGRDRLRHVEDVWTGSGADTVIGDDGANLIYIGAVNGDGADIVRAGGGQDTLSFDNAITHGCCMPLWVDLALGLATYGDGRIELSGIDNVVAQGAEDEVILGDSGKNLLGAPVYSINSFELKGMTIRGRGGDDELVGSPLRDRLYGGPGDDTMRGLGADDLLDGGGGTNIGDGGAGVDTCSRPSPPVAVACEDALIVG